MRLIRCRLFLRRLVRMYARPDGLIAACCRFITPNFSSAAGGNLRQVMTTTLSSLPLPPSIQLKLAAAGFTSVGDFDGLSAAELAEDLAVEPREAQKLLAQVRRRADTCVC